MLMYNMLLNTLQKYCGIILTEEAVCKAARKSLNIRNSWFWRTWVRRPPRQNENQEGWQGALLIRPKVRYWIIITALYGTEKEQIQTLKIKANGLHGFQYILPTPLHIPVVWHLHICAVESSLSAPSCSHNRTFREKVL